MNTSIFATSPLTTPLPAGMRPDPARLFGAVELQPGALIGHTPAQDPALAGRNAQEA